MSNRNEEMSSRLKARIAGVFYLLTIVVGGFGFYARSKVIVTTDAALTVANMRAHEMLYRLSVTAGLLSTICYVVVTILLYELFKPASRTLSLLAAALSLIGCAVGAVSFAFQVAPLQLLNGPQYARVFNVEQIQSLALLSTRVHVQTEALGLVFFGCYCVLIGCLIFKSDLMPRAVGVLMMFAGLGWLAYLYPPFAVSLFPYIVLPGLIGETALTLWLLVMGVRTDTTNRVELSPAY